MKRTRKTWAKVTFRFNGTHCWPEAPETVHWLRNKHRHVFHVTVWVEQFHSQRDVEYTLLKRALEAPYPDDLGTWSCEILAEKILEITEAFCEKMFPAARHRDIKVEVLEDGENGALVEEVVE